MQNEAQRLRIAECGLRNSPIRNPQSAFRNRRRLGGERGQALVEYAIVFPIQLMLMLAIIQLAHILIAKQVLEYAAFCGARAKLVNLSDDEARAAAIIPLSWVCPGDPVKDSAGSPPDPNAPGPHLFALVLPGWGSQTMSAQLYQQMMASFPPGPEGDAERLQLIQFYNTPHAKYLSGCGTASESVITPINQVETSPSLPGTCWMIKFNYLLRVPVGNVIAYKVGQLFLGVDSQYLTTIDTTSGPQPALVMTASCVLPNPS
jgi:hypothetical protein